MKEKVKKGKFYKRISGFMVIFLNSFVKFFAKNIWDMTLLYLNLLLVIMNYVIKGLHCISSERISLI